MQQLGPYKILAELGRGGMGAVYRARHTELGGEVALKIVRPEIADPIVIARFKREAQAAAQLAGHPGIVGVRDLGDVDGIVFLAMDLVEGADLGKIVDRGDHSPAQLAAMLRDAARAVHHAHAHGILHRDLKPDNIMIDADGVARVTDFGLAKPTALDASATRLTQTEMVLGTPSYMPPEQAQGGAVDARTDVYALGATLYDCLAGVPPFEGTTVYEVLAKVLRTEAKPLRKRDPRIPRDLDTIVMTCLEKRPADRYATAAELADDLDRYLTGTPIVARRIAAVGRAVRFLGRHRARVIVTSVVFLAAAGLTAWWYEGRERDAETTRTLQRTESATQTADLQTQLSEAYLTLDRGSWEAMRRLELRYYGAPLDGEDRTNALRIVRHTADGVQRRFPALGLPGAWIALARFYDRDAGADAAFDAARSSAPGDPFPALLHGFCKLAAYQDATDIGHFAFSQAEARRVEFAEAPALAELRHAAIDAFAEARDRGSDTLAQGREFVRLADGASALAAKRFDRAREALSPLGDDPRFSVSALGLLGLAEFLDDRMEAAATAWSRAAAGRCDELSCRAATAWLAHGTAQLSTPAESDRLLDRARDLIAPLLERNPEHHRARKLRGLVAQMRSLGEGKRGVDPRPMLRAAIADFEAVLRADPHQYVLEYNLGEAHRRMGDAAAARGEPSGPAYQAARTYLEQARRVANGRVEASAAMGVLLRAMAQRAAAGTSDPEALLTEADQCYGEVIAAWPATVSQRVNRGIVRYEIGRLFSFSGRDPVPWFQGAVADCDAAEQRKPELANIYLVRANARTLWAEFLERGGQPTIDLWATVATDYDRAIEHAPADSTMIGGRALFRVRRAGADAARGQDPRPAMRDALADFEAALKLDDSLPQMWFNYAGATYQLAVFEHRAGGANLPVLERALTAFNEGLARKPDQWLVYAHRGRVYLSLRRPAEALADFELYKKHQPGAPGIDRLIDAARAKLAERR